MARARSRIEVNTIRYLRKVIPTFLDIILANDGDCFGEGHSYLDSIGQCEGGGVQLGANKFSIEYYKQIIAIEIPFFFVSKIEDYARLSERFDDFFRIGTQFAPKNVFFWVCG